MTNFAHLDAVIVGGGAAGRSAALVLGRARRTVALIDAAQQSNLPSGGIGGLLGHDGTAPADFYAATAKELACYPTVEVVSATVNGVEPGSTARWQVHLDGGRRLDTDRILLATGMRYDKPAIPGLDGFWGSSVFHCPFCHGWEHRDEPLAVLGGAPRTAERALLLRCWTDRVTVIDPASELDPDEANRLDRAGIRRVQGGIEGLVGTGRHLESIVLSTGERLDVRGLLVAAPHTPRDGLATTLGVERTATGHVAVNSLGATSVPGVWAAGDITNPLGGVARAIAEGSTCALSITHDIVARTYDATLPATGTRAG